MLACKKSRNEFSSQVLSFPKQNLYQECSVAARVAEVVEHLSKKQEA
jgi:hypothetical protein